MLDLSKTEQAIGPAPDDRDNVREVLAQAANVTPVAPLSDPVPGGVPSR